MSDNEQQSSKLPAGLYTEKPKTKKHKSKAKKVEKMDLAAVPPHILRIVQGVEEKSKKKKEQDMNRGSDDSLTILRKMMGSVRTKCDLDTTGDEARMDKENDIAKIANARDIFKHLETNPNEENQKAVKQEKHKRVEVNADFMLEGQNKAEEIRKARLKEMALMKAARERTLEDEEMWNRENKQKSDEIKRQREMEIEMMKAARQQAIEDEERLEKMPRMEHRRSPGLEAAKNVTFSRDFVDEGANKMEQMRLERIREIEEMKRAREMMVEEESDRDGISEAAQELEAFRASRSSGSVKERYQPSDDANTSRSQTFAKAPKSRAKSDNWMVNSSQDKLEEARLTREREIEMMMVARSQAIEDEEEERATEEAERRMFAEAKAREMAVLVADLQRMRSHTARDAEEEAKMTKYQEEMLARVMELHEIARGGIQVENY
eukprot:GFUD01013527.1.p1 GENE.GFUD01013527.1~~GFUD01013527.1.p1  ORF type:complete len:436 (-),score=169.08 GFUD01013527.1:279-1586(-)